MYFVFLKEAAITHGFIFDFVEAFPFGHLGLNFKIRFLRVLNIILLIYLNKHLIILFLFIFIIKGLFIHLMAKSNLIQLVIYFFLPITLINISILVILYQANFIIILFLFKDLAFIDIVQQSIAD